MSRRAGVGAAGPRVALLLGLGLAGAACSPIYEPSFRLEPPNPLDATARQCIAACVEARDVCFEPARDAIAACSKRAILVQSQCRAQAQIEYQICQTAYGPEGQFCAPSLCQRASCPTDALDQCESDYRRCFAGCGGRVVEERRCVANCPS